MTLSKNAIGNLIAKYSAVLKKCAVLNVIAAGLIVAGAASAIAVDYENITVWSGTETASLSSFLTSSEESATKGTVTADLTQGDSAAIITVKGKKSLDLNGKNLTGGNSATGSAITVASGTSLEITSSADATSTISGFNYSTSNAGGGFIVNNGTLTVTGTLSSDKTTSTIKFYKNGSINLFAGGAINASGTTTIKNTVFEENIAQVGGAVSTTTNQEGNTTITNSIFKNNHALYDGGAVGNYGPITITDCVFEGNTAQFTQDSGWETASTDETAIGGGAISLGAVSKSIITTISGSTFTGNKSGAYGGAIGTRLGKDANNSAATYSIEATFTGNEAIQTGGAINNTFYKNVEENTSGVLVSGKFTENKAGTSGGAIYNDGSKDKADKYGGVMTIKDSTFTDNIAGTSGGAIANVRAENDQSGQGAIITFTGTNTFSGNTVGSGESKKDNDVYNTGTIKIAAEGETTFGSGYVQAATENAATPSLDVQGKLNVANADIQAGQVGVGVITGTKDEAVTYTANKDAALTMTGESNVLAADAELLNAGTFTLDTGAVLKVADNDDNRANFGNAGTVVIKGTIDGVTANETTSYGKFEQDSYYGTVAVDGANPNTSLVGANVTLGAVVVDAGTLTGDADSTVTLKGKTYEISGSVSEHPLEGTVTYGLAAGFDNTLNEDRTTTAEVNLAGTTTVSIESENNIAAVVAGRNATVTLGKAEVSASNTADNTYTAAAVAFGGTLTINDGTLSATGKSGKTTGVWAHDATVNLTSAEVSANGSGKVFGAAVDSHSNQSSITVEGGSLFAKTTSTKDDKEQSAFDEAVGLYVAAQADKNATATVSDAKISAEGTAVAVAVGTFGAGTTSVSLKDSKLSATSGTNTNNAAVGVYAVEQATVTFAGTNEITLSGKNLNLFEGEGTIKNSGTLTAKGDYSVRDFTGTYNQTAGTTDFSALKTTAMNGAYNISGGTFLAKDVTVAGGENNQLSVSGGTMTADNLTNDGTVSVSGGELEVTETLTNGGNFTVTKGGSASATSFVNKTTVTIEKGGTLEAGTYTSSQNENTATTNTVAGTLSTEKLVLTEDSGGITVSGGNLAVTKSANVLGTIITAKNLTKAEYTADVLDATYASKINATGTDGNNRVVLYIADEEPTTANYTSAFLTKAAAEMFKESGEKGELILQNGMIELSGDDKVVAGASVEDTTATLTSTPKVVESGKTANDSNAAVASNQTVVALVDGSTTENTPVEVSKVKVGTNESAQKFSAQALQVSDKSTAVTMEVTNSDLTFSGNYPIVTDAKGENGVATSFNLTSSELTLSGSDVDLKGGTMAATKSSTVEAGGNLTAQTVEVTAGSNLSVAGNLTTEGTVKVEDDSNLSVKNGTIKATNVEIGGTDTILVAKDVTVESLSVAGGSDATVGSSDATVGGSLATDKITIEDKAILKIINAVASIGELTLSGGRFLIDPTDASIDSISDTITSEVDVLEGSRMAVAMTPQRDWDKNKAVLLLGQAVTLGSGGKIVVDQSVNESTYVATKYDGKSIYFDKDTVLVVDGTVAKTTPMITAAAGTGTAYIDAGSKLYVVNAANANVDDVYHIVKADSIEGGWENIDLETQSAMLTPTFVIDEANGEGDVIIKKTGDAKDVMKPLDGELANLVDNLYDKGLHDADSATPGVKFLSRASDGTVSVKDGVKAIESISRIGALGAVPQMSIMASESLTDAIGNRMNIANGMNAIQEQKLASSLALWITPLWKNQTGWGMEACSFNNGYVGNIGGIALGADYAFNDFWKAGLAFNIGGGYATSNGDLQETDNNMNFWGLGVYGGYNDGTLSVMADVAYTGTYNKLEQSMVDGMGMKKANADVQASLWTVGIRGDYKFALEALDITPHVALRFQNLSSQEYDIKAGGTVAKSDGIQQTIWSVPVGVTFGKDFTTSGGWALTPSVDFTVTPRFGDLKATETLKFTGVPGEADLRTQTRDYITYKGTAGIGAKYDNIGLNLNYSYEGGSCTSSHGVNATFKWEF